MQTVKCKNAGYSWARLLINIINLLVVITLLTIILYVAFNYKKILTNAIQGGLDAVNDKRSNIQGSINKFASTTVNYVLDDNEIRMQIKDLVNEVTVPVIDTLQENLRTAMPNMGNKILPTNIEPDKPPENPPIKPPINPLG